MRENELYMEMNKTWKRNQNNNNKKSIGLLGKEEEGSVKYKGRKKFISTITHLKGSERVDSYSSEPKEIHEDEEETILPDWTGC